MASRRSPAGPTLSRRALNRTLLARQHLLERVARPPLEVVEDLVGLQAQEPTDPYVALWSRIADFDPRTLSDALAERRAVRIGLMRTTLHLVSTDDALGLAPVMDPVLRRAFASTAFDKALAGADRAAVTKAARQALESASAVAVNALTGVLDAGRKNMDLVGVVMVGSATALGGGTVRDILLDRKVFWISDQTYLIVALATTLAAFWAVRGRCLPPR